MIFEFGQYKVDIDVCKTQNFYENAAFVSEGCSCDGCQNFEKAVAALPQVVQSFFTQLGIDMGKICECYVNCVNEDGTLLYGGFYHVCGVILSGDSAWIKIDENTAYWETENAFRVSRNFCVCFQESVDLLEEDFPQPAIQLEILADIPWVLEKENSYSL